MLAPVFLLAFAGYAFGNIYEGLGVSSLDGEVAMKNMEAAQVKMEQKLNSMTSFIDQELEKAKDSPIAVRYSRKKRAVESNPLLNVPEDKVKEILASMKSLSSSFIELRSAYDKYKVQSAKSLEMPAVDEAKIKKSSLDKNKPSEEDIPNKPVDDPLLFDEVTETESTTAPAVTKATVPVNKSFGKNVDIATKGKGITSKGGKGKGNMKIRRKFGKGKGKGGKGKGKAIV